MGVLAAEELHALGAAAETGEVTGSVVRAELAGFRPIVRQGIHIAVGDAVVLETELREPRVPVLSCVTAQPFDDVRERLVQALTHPVRWLDVMRALQERGVTRFVDTGPGRVLANLVRKSLEGVEADAPLAMEAANA